MWWEIALIIFYYKIIAEFVSYLCLDVSKRISGIILIEHSGRSWVIRVLLGGEKVAIVYVEPVDFPEIRSTCHQVLSPSCYILELIVVHVGE